MKRIKLVLSHEFAYQWHSLTGFVSALFFTFLLIFISGYAYNYVQTLPDVSDVAVVFCLVFLISTQFSVTFLGMRSKSFVQELKILPFSGANIFLCRAMAIFAGIVVITIISVLAFIIFFNLDVSIASALLLILTVLIVSIAQISLGLITQFNFVGNHHLSNYALIFTLPMLFPVFTAMLFAVKNILAYKNVNMSEILIIIGLDMLYCVAALFFFEYANKN